MGVELSALQLVSVLRDESALAGAHDIEVCNGLAYLAGKRGSLALVEVRQPASPKLLWSVCDPQRYEDAETVLPLKPDRWLVGTRDVWLFDVSRSASPKVLAQLKDRPPVDSINGFARHGPTVFAANKQGFLLAVSISASDTIRLLGARDTRRRAVARKRWRVQAASSQSSRNTAAAPMSAPRNMAQRIPNMLDPRTDRF